MKNEVFHQKFMCFLVYMCGTSSLPWKIFCNQIMPIFTNNFSKKLGDLQIPPPCFFWNSAEGGGICSVIGWYPKTTDFPDSESIDPAPQEKWPILSWGQEKIFALKILVFFLYSQKIHEKHLLLLFFVTAWCFLIFFSLFLR